MFLEGMSTTSTLVGHVCTVQLLHANNHRNALTCTCLNDDQLGNKCDQQLAWK